MKKTIAYLIFLCCLSLFAETGYRGHEWYTKAYTFPGTGRETCETPGWANVLIYKKAILKESNFLFYGFSFDNEEFINAGYVIQKESTEELKTQLKSKKKTVIKINLGDYGNLDEEIGGEAAYGDKEYNRFYFDQFSLLAQMLETYGTEEIREDPNATLTIYDYNDDTRLYLFEGVNKDMSVVVYVPHEQDY